jgi:hypothetical protein
LLLYLLDIVSLDAVLFLARWPFFILLWESSFGWGSFGAARLEVAAAAALHLLSMVPALFRGLGEGSIELTVGGVGSKAVADHMFLKVDLFDDFLFSECANIHYILNKTF